MPKNLEALEHEAKIQRLEAWHWENYLDPVGYCRANLGIELWAAQKRIIEALRDHRFVSVRSSNAVGKSFLASCCVPWYLQTRPCGYVVTTAATWKGLEKILWPEIHRRILNARVTSLRRLGHLLKTEWQIAPHYEAFAISPQDPEGFGGFRTPYGVLVIVDEASNMPQSKYDAIMGLCSGSASKVLLIGNPLRDSGPFYDSFRHSTWASFRISAFDCPNVIFDREIIPGLATREWVKERRIEWGTDSPAYRSRVLGEFPEDAEHSVITLAEVQAAVDRGEDTEIENEEDEPIDLGVDVARFGDDATVLQAVQGKRAFMPVEHWKRDTMQIVGEIVAAIRELNPREVKVDEIGVGGGVVDRLHELGHTNVYGINVGNNPRDTNRFANLRAEGWWMMKEWVESGGILPDHKRLIGDLSSCRYEFTSSGKIKIEEKERTKKRLKRSPDNADALMLALIKPYAQVEIW